MGAMGTVSITLYPVDFLGFFGGGGVKGPGWQSGRALSVVPL